MKQVQVLTENLQALGHEVFSYVGDTRNFVLKTELDKSPDSFNPGDDWQSRDQLKKMFDHNMIGIVESSVVIMLFPAGHTSHIEAGIGYGLNKKLILIGEVENVEPHYLIFSEWYKTIDDFIASLTK